MISHAAPSLKDLRLYQGGRGASLCHHAQRAGAAGWRPLPAFMNLGTRGHTIVFDLAMPTSPLYRRRTSIFQVVTLSCDCHRHRRRYSAVFERDSSWELYSLRFDGAAPLRQLHASFAGVQFPLSACCLDCFGCTRTRAASLQVLGWSKGRRFRPAARHSLSILLSLKIEVSFGRVARALRSSRCRSVFLSSESRFVLAPNFKANFSRDVHVSDRPAGTPQSAAETIDGTIFRVHLTQAAREIRQQQLSVPATLGANMQGPASVKVTIENGDDTPLPVIAVRLEMRQRKLCFNAPTTQAMTLFYGDAGLQHPEYDYPRFFVAARPYRYGAVRSRATESYLSCPARHARAYRALSGYSLDSAARGDLHSRYRCDAFEPQRPSVDKWFS